MIALVLAGGPLHATPRLRSLAAEATLVIAADGGLRHAATLQLTPDLLVGDLDSVRPQDLAAWPELAREVHPRDKDALDLELALDAALLRGALVVRVLGAFGGRVDQTLATALIVGRYAREGLGVTLLDGRHDAYPVVSGGQLDLPLPDGTVFSLLAIGTAARVDVTNAKFPLAGARLEPGVGLGLSNRALGSPHVHVHEGQVLVIVEWEVDDIDASMVHPRFALWGNDSARIEAELRATDEDLADLIVDVAYGNVFAREGLDHRTRSLLAIAHLTGLGSDVEIRTHLRALQRQGGTLDEAKEAILHAAMFVGFPRSLTAMRAWARERERERLQEQEEGSGAAASGGEQGGADQAD